MSASMHVSFLTENGGAKNTLKYSYLQIMVWLSPYCLRGGVLQKYWDKATIVGLSLVHWEYYRLAMANCKT